MPRIIAALVFTLALGTGIAGCAAKSGTDGAAGSSGAGQLGEGAITPDDAGAPTPVPVATTPAPTPSPTTAPIPGVILTIDPGLLLPWPSPADCVGHNPSNVSILYTASGPLWQIVDGSHALMAFKRSADATAGLALAKAYKTHCFIGRGNTRTNRAQYIMDYWRDPVQTAPAITSPDCLPHTPSALTIENLGSLGWRIDNGSEAVELFDTQADANDALLVMKHYNRHCYIGRGNGSTDPNNDYIVTWFANM